MTATPEPQFPDILGSSFKDFLAAAEQDLAGHRAELEVAENRVRGLRRRQRRARRRELLQSAPHAARAAAKYGLIAAGLIAFVAAIALLGTGQSGSIEFFIAGATAWSTAAVIPR
ncbi:hypothetical protein [Streptomyces sp. NPDC050564]|uniref:hypothetical protein n=1 Tax=Streptomyces sp. NPDC050564 TaxID=3365631 RepID=UPI0037AADFE4